MFTPIIIPKPSPRAHRLSEKIVRCIQDEHKENPNLTFEDVRQACQLALDAVSSIFGKSQATARNIAIGMGIILALLTFSLAFLLTSR